MSVIMRSCVALSGAHTSLIGVLDHEAVFLAQSGGHGWDGRAVDDDGEHMHAVLGLGQCMEVRVPRAHRTG
jgi:hypothetical protein